jgi:hypothetical protein
VGQEPKLTDDQGPGVPEAIPRTLQALGERLDPATLDRVWIFPPLVRGRRERGLLAASRFLAPQEGGPEGDAEAHPEAPSEAHPAVHREDGAGAPRTLFTAPYTAERTGRGLTLEWDLVEQGSAPPDRLPRVMRGVVRRADSQLGDPREVELAGDPERFHALLDELGIHLLEQPAPSTAEEA